MKIMLRVPTRGQITDTTSRWMRAVEKLYPTWDIDSQRNTYGVAACRNIIVKEAFDKEVDFLYMVDDDVLPSENALKMHLHNKPVIAGRVPCWQKGHLFWNIFDYDEQRKLVYTLIDFTKGLQQIYVTGTGLICIRKDVIQDERMKPHFGERLNEWGFPVNFGSDDMQFGVRCNTYGHSVWVDPEVHGDHNRSVSLGDTVCVLQQSADNPQFTIPEQFGIGVNHIPFKLPSKVCESEDVADRPATIDRNNKTIKLDRKYFQNLRILTPSAK